LTLKFGQIFVPKAADKCLSDNFGVNAWVSWQKGRLTAFVYLHTYTYLTALIFICKFRPKRFHEIDSSSAILAPAIILLAVVTSASGRRVRLLVFYPLQVFTLIYVESNLLFRDLKPLNRAQRYVHLFWQFFHELLQFGTIGTIEKGFYKTSLHFIK
jgi:hypothetical protein